MLQNSTNANKKHAQCFLILSVFLIGYSINTTGQSFFHNVADSVGIFHTYGDGLFGGGLSFYDFDGDGWDDLTLTSKYGESLSFYKNMGGTFEVAGTPFVANQSESKQVLWVDVDNDGDKDLFITGRYFNGSQPNLARTRLYENDGNFNFTDITVSSGLPIEEAPTFGANFGDVNNDGWLDLLVMNRSGYSSPYINHLYLNNGNGTFSDHTSAIPMDTTMIFCGAFFDFDNDLDQDIYMAADKYFGNPFFRNEGNAVFTEAGQISGAGISIDAMNVGVGDYDNNGYLDIYCTNTYNSPDGGSKLLRNNGNGTFDEVAVLAGVEYTSVGWGANWLDLDNDGDLDLYVSGTWPAYPQTQSTCYVNDGTGTFSMPNMGFVGDITASYTNAVGDFNNDGFPDIMVNNEGPDKSQLWMNHGGDSHWLKVKLEGIISNRDGIGSFIECYLDGQKTIRYTHCGIAYLAQNSGTEIFGLGQSMVVDSLKVRWLSGVVDVLYGVDADQVIQVMEGSTTMPTSIGAQDSERIRVYPNPASEYVAVQLPGRSPMLELTLLNSSGRTIAAQIFLSGTKAIIDLHGLASGLYFIRVHTDQGVMLKKIKVM